MVRLPLVSSAAPARSTPPTRASKQSSPRRKPKSTGIADAARCRCVWLAAVWAGHAHHPRVASWFTEHDGELFLCRVAQLGLLRLLSHPAVLGEDVLAPTDAWKVLDMLRSDDRVRWAGEPTQLEHVWRAISARTDNSHKLWTDDYLAAFAQAAETHWSHWTPGSRGAIRRSPSTHCPRRE
ncbi:TA system VapC family ribonuclease toxin [Saccharomonospora marina]|uniref:TA system VapC family ribonuclease toxin n=1 Tax=Saccharomonospora marina TaxID=632569 RepID=UPI0038CD3396